ncbi:hypothetical protein EJB05_10556, partial [Eragrostis curvula]
MENLTQASPRMEGSADSAATTTARRGRKPGRWRRIPRATARAETTSERWPCNGVLVVERGSREWAEEMERSNKRMLQRADELEQQQDDEEGCDTEEAKLAFRAFKLRTCRFYRTMANTKPQDVVSVHHKPPASDTR